jgi:hypothetical protein
MKTQLLVLEPHDDLISVRDRMSWAKTPRILLVWPVGEKIALRAIDLKILERHARSLGARLGLITRDRRVRREAAALGLPIFESTSAAQRDLWPAPVKRTFRPSQHADLRAMQSLAHPAEARWRTYPITRVVFFALGVLAVLAIAALFVPRAEIALSPESKTQSLTIPVVADPALNIVFITGNIPAREMTRTVAGSQNIASTGAATVPEIEAKGVARFRNLTASAVQIPLGTVVQTRGVPPIRFVTTQAAEVPKGIGKTVDVAMEAVNAGERGNLEADLVQAIEGSLGLLVSVTNPAPTTGGTDQKLAAPSADDRERLRGALLESLRTKVQADILAGLPAGSVVFPKSVTEVQALEETYDPPAGETGTTLSLTLRVSFSARYASGDDLLNLASLALGASVEQGFAAAPDSLTVKLAGAPTTGEDGRTHFLVQVDRRIVRFVDARQVIALVQGRRLEIAQAQLKQVSGLSAAPQISLSPAWWPWLPLAPFRITVVIQ